MSWKILTRSWKTSNVKLSFKTLNFRWWVKARANQTTETWKTITHRDLCTFLRALRDHSEYFLLCLKKKIQTKMKSWGQKKRKRRSSTRNFPAFSKLNKWESRISNRLSCIEFSIWEMLLKIQKNSKNWGQKLKRHGLEACYQSTTNAPNQQTNSLKVTLIILIRLKVQK